MQTCIFQITISALLSCHNVPHQGFSNVVLVVWGMPSVLAETERALVPFWLYQRCFLPPIPTLGIIPSLICIIWIQGVNKHGEGPSWMPFVVMHLEPDAMQMVQLGSWILNCCFLKNVQKLWQLFCSISGESFNSSGDKKLPNLKIQNNVVSSYLSYSGVITLSLSQLCKYIFITIFTFLYSPSTNSPPHCPAVF